MSHLLCDIIITFRINIIFLGEFLTVTVDFPSFSAKPNITTFRALQRLHEQWKYEERGRNECLGNASKHPEMVPVEFVRRVQSLKNYIEKTSEQVRTK